MILSVREVQDGLRAESEDLPGYLSFKILDSHRIDDVWHVVLDTESAIADNGKRNIVLDEALEGARVWWQGSPNGAADILAVIPEESALLLSQSNTNPPASGKWIRVYVQDFLSALRDIWNRTDWANNSIKYQQVLIKQNLFEPMDINPSLFPYLRKAQIKSFELLNYETGFLWGPPGTGKTTTLGALMASCVIQKPDLRILLLGTTNQAVDQALVAVDKALERLGANYHKQRERLCRFGSRFIAEHYQGRDHLIPILDKQMLNKLRSIELDKPDSTAAPDKISEWHQKHQDLRNKIRQQMANLFRNKSIVGMTASRATYSLVDPEFIRYFDILVFDEASQAGLANVLCLLPLGKRFLFAGDDKQLSPIVTSTNKKAMAVLGKSPFIYRNSGDDGLNTVMLNEQSRMAEPICRVVSEVFYQGRLHVAEDAKHNKEWLAKRSFNFGEIEANSSMNCIDVLTEGTWSQKYRGLIRHESATRIADMVSTAIACGQVLTSEIAILTPFRAQRSLIKNFLYHKNIKGVKVLTVHRSQGSEARVVIFDPVKGDEDFLSNSEGLRLINVALSRAMGKLILFLSPIDRKNIYLSQFYNLSKLGATTSSSGAIKLSELLKTTRESSDIVGKLVTHGKHIGVIKAFNEPPDFLTIASHITGQDHNFQLSFIYQKIESD